MNRHRNLAALVLSAATLVACGDSGQTDITEPAPAAQIMFFNEGLGAPNVNFYADTAKLTAISSSSGTPSTLGTGYSQVAAGGYYVGINPGQYTLTAHTSDTTNTQIASVAQTVAAGKAYSYFLSGPYDATAKKVADAWVVEDPIPATYDYSTGNVRFVNAIYNANGGSVTLVNNDTTIHPTPAPITLGAAVPYKSAGAFVPVPAGSYTVTVTGLAPTGSVAGAIAVGAGHYYSLIARGDMTVTSSKAATFPKVDVQINR
jgi:hypothetical protein